jgi:hypothetical protein
LTVASDQMAWVKEIEGDFEFSHLWAKYTEIVGLKITAMAIGGDGPEHLCIRFDDGSAIFISDEGQSCCERRYITCDDDLSGHEGGQLVSINTDASGSGPDVGEDDYGCHEVQFVAVQTTKGCFTLCTHNEHNGYYGGFGLKVKRVR